MFFDWIALGTKWRMDYKEIGVELIKLHKKYQIKKKTVMIKPACWVTYARP